MNTTHRTAVGRSRFLWILGLTPLFGGLALSEASAQVPLRDGDVTNRAPYLYAAADFGIDPAGVTFTKDIAPILQRTCQGCHHPGGGGPMSLVTFNEVRRWAPRIKERTAIRDRMGSMPPWFIEKSIGVQHFKNDPSLSDEELAKIQAWVDNGAPEGDPADMPPPLDFSETGAWTLGEPDLVVKGPEITMPAVGADRWGDVGLVPTGTTEDRYVQSVEVREVNDIPLEGTGTVGGRYIFHHMTYGIGVLTEDGMDLVEGTRQGWPIHEVGRNADVMADDAGLLLPANAALDLSASHLHPNGRETTGYLEFGFKFFPEGYKPTITSSGLGRLGLFNSVDVHSLPGEIQEFHVYNVLDQHMKMVTFEPHMHAPGVRQCVEAIWGGSTFTINCVGYDHNWVKQYVYEEDSAPLLPKGTILHLYGWMDMTDNNPNIADNRNWAGSGRRSVANMFQDLGQAYPLTEEQFQAAMAERRALMRDRNDFDVGCLLCWSAEVVDVESLMEKASTEAGGGQE